MSNTKAVKNSNMEEVMRMMMELCKRSPKKLIREFGVGEKMVEILNNNIKIMEMQVKIKELEKQGKERKLRKVKEREQEEIDKWIKNA